jgi:hypothetical protein
VGDRLGEQWRDYRARVIPVQAPTIQARECRRAFYAGAASMLQVIMVGLEPGLEPTKEDLAKMDELMAELDRFADALKEGRA